MSTDQLTESDAKVAACRSYLLPFIVATKRNYLPNWHHYVKAEALEAVERGEIKRLMILEPPRHGKTEEVSIRFPGWYLGKHPDHGIITAAYSGDLAQDYGRQVLDLVKSEEFFQIFGDLTMREVVRYEQEKLERTKQTTHEFITNAGGAYRSVGVGGSVLGKGCHGLLVDDPIKNRDEANSLVYREKVWQWYTNVALTRLEPDGFIIVILHRWHEDDLAGRLLAHAEKGGDQWTVLSFPALCDRDDDPYRKRGEALWPARGWTREKLEKIRSINPMAFESLYQQRPRILGGNIFKETMLSRFYRRAELPATFDTVVASWDMSFKDTASGSYVVGQVWARTGRKLFLLDEARDHLGFSDTKKAFRALSERYPSAFVKLVEDKANGPAILDELKTEFAGLTPVNPRGTKEERAQLAADTMTAMEVLLPHPDEAPWIQDYITELLNFPNAAANDRVDATSQALDYLDEPVSIMSATKEAEQGFTTQMPEERLFYVIHNDD